MFSQSGGLDRRRFLQSTGAGLAAATAAHVLGRSPLLAADGAKDPYAGLKMGIQSYSLRGYEDPKVALEHTKAFGLKYWEAYPAHVPINSVPKTIEGQKAMLKEAGVELTAYGVLSFDANETTARQYFDFAKAMGIVSLSANPKKEKATFDLLDKLVAEYDVAIAIHNHGPGALYDKIADVETWVKDRHPKVGACVDTGHYLRSDEDPVEAIERLGKRVYGVHLKDVKTFDNGGKREKKFTVAGQGDLNVLGCLKALKKLDYRYVLAIEYEENPQNPLADIDACLKHVREEAAKV